MSWSRSGWGSSSALGALPQEYSWFCTSIFEKGFLGPFVGGKKRHQSLVDVSDICYSFYSGEGKGESDAPGGGGVDFLLKNARRGGGVSGEGGGGWVSVGNFGRGGGAKYFFSGPKCPPRKVFSALRTQVPQQAKKEVWCVPKSLFSREKEGKYIYTPKSLPGVCAGPLRAVLVYRFWPPILTLAGKKSRCHS